jgi:drug/metabolite transporter (DMT)-like permease
MTEIRTPLPARPPRVAAATVALGLCAVLFGLVPGFARELQAAGLPDAAIAFWRFAFAGLLLAAFLPRARETRGEALSLAGAGLLMGLGWTGYLSLVGSASIATAGVIYMSYPLFALLFAWLLLGLAPGARGLVAAIAVLAAAALLLRGPAALSPGDLLRALPAPVTFGLAIVAISALAPGLRPAQRMACITCGTLAGLLPALAFTGGAGAILPTDPGIWPVILGLGVVTALLPQVVYTLAAPHVGPGRAAATGALELPVMILLGWLAFGETAGPREAFAAALVLGAVALAPAIDTRALPPRRRKACRGALPGYPRICPDTETRMTDEIAHLPDNPMSHADRKALEAYGAHVIAHGWATRFHWDEDDDAGPRFEIHRGGAAEFLEARVGRSRAHHAFYAEDVHGVVFATGTLDHVMAALEERLSDAHGG